MRIARLLVAALTAISAVPAAGCVLSTGSASAQPPDYTAWLIQAGDVNAAQLPTGTQAFTAGAPINNPDGRPGATITFGSPDRTHVIYDTIEVFSDPAAATRALEKAKAAPDGYVHGFPEPIAIGIGGTKIEGPSPDGTKGVTVMMFTEGPAFAQIQFDDAPRSVVSPEFVTDVSQKQDAAIKKGLTG
jgi:hypothetical protein